jgi:membrane protein DedA with SNARE-associated domain
MDSIFALINGFIENFQELGVLAYWILFAIAFLDSVIVTGTFLNGTLFLMLAGVMVSKGTHEFAPMAIFAAVGAVCGGVVSFYLGQLGSRYVKRKEPKEKERYGAALRLFKQYGGFSVFIGRFFGPVSSIVAFLAGTLAVSRASFWFWNTLAGICWGVGYVTIGRFLGDSLTFLQIL